MDSLKVYIVFICASIFIFSVEGSRKKGVAAWAGGLLCDDFKVLNNMSWWYDWKQDLTLYHKHVTQVCPTATDSYMPEFVPMVWSYHSGMNLTIPDSASFILGFNEPNHQDQANMTPQDAAAAWPEIERLSNGRPLVSPAPAGHGFAWLDQFFHHCHGCRVDYIGAHTYECNVDHVMNFLHQLYQKYGKKVWLTEFACSHTTNEDKQLHYMQALLPRLEAAHYVYRYSWFMARVKRVFGNGFLYPSASLLHNSTSTLTKLGHFYNNFQGQSGASLVG